ncbi:MAG: DUF3574 domain-containing protein [Caulobacteraceae bacterium]|nr:DUF3574 domain-containing protein [Caulobacteraceae bacterium]
MPVSRVRLFRIGAARTGLVLALGATLLGGCATPARAVCGADTGGRTAELYFGRSIKTGGEVADDVFIRFLDEVVTPLFPDGLTVSDAQGRWRAPTGRTVRENSKVVMIVLPGHADDRAHLESVRQAYRQRFHQDSVLLVTRPACVAF